MSANQREIAIKSGNTHRIPERVAPGALEVVDSAQSISIGQRRATFSKRNHHPIADWKLNRLTRGSWRGAAPEWRQGRACPGADAARGQNHGQQRDQQYA